MICIDEYIKFNSLLGFEIGKILDLSKYKEGIDYNPIGYHAMAFNFFSNDITVEVSLENGLIDSFDILLKYQDESFCLGSDEGQGLFLREANFKELGSFLSKRSTDWVPVLNNETYILSYYFKNMLKVSFVFDEDNDGRLELINLSGV